ncbi:50S ribosomal protein L22 [Pyrinomonas methylaliphatogenes]|jgi:large subunit ribosomal protein L22|uniref:Large ribosomal subunit protein uL22 n=1 Tax=Pyrinomonas methylaliphatogenes TaxID=454194 RepID=A0A0B6WXY7_9BACT|nr:50S ribosomal protein L22 [Pyrinomonas methylaliphatogenes]MBX5479592.1 50S ribosomal protein L22 [Pyrinomonas methylaliphatogenes]CDM66118.1 ribosomal protein L22, bacterial type [Pyrinomonas methylaliphatogenes]
MEAIARARYQRGSPQKTRLVVDLIRGKNVNEALAILRYANKRAARTVEKCLRSAIANATELAERDNIAIDPDELWIKAAYVDQGPTKRRYRIRPAPHGRAYRERRHYCHITLLLSTEERSEKATRRAKAPEAATGNQEE